MSGSSRDIDELIVGIESEARNGATVGLAVACLACFELSFGGQRDIKVSEGRDRILEKSKEESNRSIHDD